VQESNTELKYRA